MVHTGVDLATSRDKTVITAVIRKNRFTSVDSIEWCPRKQKQKFHTSVENKLPREKGLASDKRYCQRVVKGHLDLIYSHPAADDEGFQVVLEHFRNYDVHVQRLFNFRGERYYHFIHFCPEGLIWKGVFDYE